MPPKKPGRYSCLDSQVNGWSFKVYIDGMGKAQVGTAAKGQAYKRWSFWLTSYEEDKTAQYADFVESCVQHEMVTALKCWCWSTQ